MVQIKFSVAEHVKAAIENEAKDRDIPFAHAAREIFMAGYVQRVSQKLHSREIQEKLELLELLEKTK